METEHKSMVCRFAGGVYRLYEIMGEGTFGRVYKARNETTREYVAIKIVF